MNAERPEWVKCIAHTHAEKKGQSWCGRHGIQSEFHFVDVDHALYSGLNKDRLQTCPKCAVAVRNALAEGEWDGGIEDALEAFLAEFPDNATSWAQATGELPDMYAWMTDRYNAAWVDGEIDDEAGPLLPVGRENCPTPAEWNRKYKEAIRLAFGRLDVNLVERFEKRFSEWLSARRGSP